MTNPKPKAKRKPRQWKLKGWVAVPTHCCIGGLAIIDLGDACRNSRCDETKAALLSKISDTGSFFTVLRLDIVATVR